MKSKTEIIEIIKQGLIQTLELDSNISLRLDNHLRDDLGLDSLSSMEFLVYLEDEIEGFVVNAETIEARSFNTVETISNYVCAELGLVDSANMATAS